MGRLSREHFIRVCQEEGAAEVSVLRAACGLPVKGLAGIRARRAASRLRGAAPTVTFDDLSQASTDLSSALETIESVLASTSKSDEPDILPRLLAARDLVVRANRAVSEAAIDKVA